MQVVFFPLNMEKIGVKIGAIMASADVFELKIHGKGAHGATPHKSKDPIPVACEIILGLQKIISREINPLSNAVLTIGKIQGGTAQNIIPDIVTIVGTVRTLDEEVRQFIAKRIDEISTGLANAYGCVAELDYLNHMFRF